MPIRKRLYYFLGGLHLNNARSHNNATCPPRSCKGEATRSKRGGAKYHAQNWSLPPVEDCQICGVVRYLRESQGFCCLRGRVSLVLPHMPLQLWNLYTSMTSPAAAHFQKRCRAYNNTTAFSSLVGQISFEAFRS